MLTIEKLQEAKRLLETAEPGGDMAIIPIQFRFPKSKKRRIRDKWRKDLRNYYGMWARQGLDGIFVPLE